MPNSSDAIKTHLREQASHAHPNSDKQTQTNRLKAVTARSCSQLSWLLQDTLTQYEAHHGAQVASAAAQVEEGQARLQVQGLHHLRVDTGRREVDVPVSPGQVLVGIVAVLLQVVVGAVDGSEGALHQVRADVVRLLQVVNQFVVVLPCTHRSPHCDERVRDAAVDLGGVERNRETHENTLPVADCSCTDSRG